MTDMTMQRSGIQIGSIDYLSEMFISSKTLFLQ